MLANGTKALLTFSKFVSFVLITPFVDVIWQLDPMAGELTHRFHDNGRHKHYICDLTRITFAPVSTLIL